VNVKPSAMLMLGGGVVLFFSTFLDWVSARGFGASGIDTDVAGLQGIFVLLIGLTVAGITAATTFGDVKLPDEILGFTMDQMLTKLAFAAFLITFGLVFRSNAGIGLWLGVIASIVILVGGFLKQKEGSETAPDTTT